jgi:hypothetical protein
MALRFRRRITIAPGIWINLSKRGASVSAGQPGATVNIGKNGVTRTIGIPGTGISDRSTVTASGESQVVVDRKLVATVVIGLAIGLVVAYFGVTWMSEHGVPLWLDTLVKTFSAGRRR